MVRGAFIACASLLIVSCGAREIMPGGAGDIDRAAPDWVESERQEIGDRELTQDEFENLERFGENPADPRDGGLDEILSIPGFPERLARRVVAVKKQKYGDKRWIDRLTPPEIEELYRYRDYLVLPERRRARLNARITEDKLFRDDARRTDGRISFSMDDWSVLWRGRYSGGGGAGAGAFYLTGNVLSGALRIHAGSFVPDFGMGLLFGGSSSSYLFAGAYPFHGSRRIAGNASFYGQSIRGAAGELWYRNARGVFFAGRPCEYRSGRFELEGGRLFGGRLDLHERSLELGVSGFAGTSESFKALYSIDARWRSDEINLGFDLGSRGGHEPGGVWGLSYRSDKARAAFLLYAIPPGTAGRFGRVNGRALDTASSYGGATFVAEGRTFWRMRLRAAFDRYGRGDGFEESGRDALRMECEKKWRRLFLRVSWASAISGGDKVIPFPGEGDAAHDRTASLGIHSTLRVAEGMSFKLVMRRVRENDGSGMLCAPSLNLEFFEGKIRANASGALYRACEGKPVCYFYEPSLKGVYPWVVATHNTKRLAFLINCVINALTVSSKVALEEGKPPEGALQASIEL